MTGEGVRSAIERKLIWNLVCDLNARVPYTRARVGGTHAAVQCIWTHPGVTGCIVVRRSIVPAPLPAGVIINEQAGELYICLGSWTSFAPTLFLSLSLHHLGKTVTNLVSPRWVHKELTLIARGAEPPGNVSTLAWRDASRRPPFIPPSVFSLFRASISFSRRIPLLPSVRLIGGNDSSHWNLPADSDRRFRNR